MHDHNHNQETIDSWDASHRPWPLPKLPWLMKQTWNDLLFAHYPVKLENLRNTVPDALPLDSFDGMGWVSVVPFHMTGIRLRGLPPIPGTDRFPELNVRTYVTIDDKPGVYFFSLDATNWLAVKMAKMFYHLPYVQAEIQVKQAGDFIAYDSRRRSVAEARLSCRYRPISEPFLAVKGSFDEWLTERYCLYALNRAGVPFRCDIMHRPWPLQRAEAEFRLNSMLDANGVPVESGQPVLHVAKKLEVRIWPLIRT